MALYPASPCCHNTARVDKAINDPNYVSEKRDLLEKHDQVRNRVDAIVTRLKSLETGA